METLSWILRLLAAPMPRTEENSKEMGGGFDQSLTANNFPFKDIVQPKKRGVKRGTIRFVLTSYTIADIFLTYVKG